MTKQIPLSRGLFALVDDEDFEVLNQYKWYAQRGWGATFYAARDEWLGNGKKRMVYMHREIMKIEEGVKIDHINGDGLDNRRANLRPATTSQNGMNAKPRKHTSKYKGVSWDKRKKSFVVRLRNGSKYLFLGYFESELEAARVYDRKASEIFGEYAYLNFNQR